VEWVLTTGRTVSEAVESALDQLGVDERDAEIDVVQEPQKGLFGRLRAEAQVRARVRPTAPRRKVDRRERRRGERRGREGDGNRGKSRAGSGASPADGNRRSPGSSGSSGRRGASGADPAREPASDAAVAVAQPDESTQEQARPGGSSNRRRRGGRTSEGADVVSESMESTEALPAADFDIEGQSEAVETFLTELLAAFGRDDAEVTATRAEDDSEALEVSVDGPELGLLVGHQGVTLQAVQELVRSMVQRRFVGQAHVRVRLDIAGYRARRKIALERFAREVAEGVRSTGEAKALDPMGSADRKIVHDAINDIEGVSTVSEGEDAGRRVVIRPS
jgi:spoIIIJ-associated protein